MRAVKVHVTVQEPQTVEVLEEKTVDGKLQGVRVRRKLLRVEALSRCAPPQHGCIVAERARDMRQKRAFSVQGCDV